MANGSKMYSASRRATAAVSEQLKSTVRAGFDEHNMALWHELWAFWVVLVLSFG